MKDVFREFMNIIRKLRSKDGCPWDREQTHESLKVCLVEECYETIEAIDNCDTENLCEELGDLLLQVAMHSVIAEEIKEFTIDDVIANVSEKMIRRHPHVFGSVQVENADDVVKNWEEIKAKEKNSVDAINEINSIPRAFPSTLRADKVLKKVEKYGYKYQGDQNAFSKVYDRLEMLKNSVEIGDETLIIDDFGEVMLAMINLSRFLHINAENSLTNSTNKFINRFVDVISFIEKGGKNLGELSPAEQDALWRKME